MVRQVFLIVSRLKDRRLPILDRSHDRIRFYSEDRKSDLPFSGLRICPWSPEPRHTERLLTHNRELILGLPSGSYLRPVKERIGRDDAASAKFFSPETRPINALGTGDEQMPVGQFETPSHHIKVALAVRVKLKDRLHGTWGGLILGAEVEFFQPCVDRKYLSDTLLIGGSLVASAHKSSLELILAYLPVLDTDRLRRKVLVSPVEE